MGAARAGIWTVLAGILAAGAGVASAVGGSFLNQPLSVRQMGEGNVSAVSGDLLRAWTNPALLASQVTSGALAVSGAACSTGPGCQG